MNKQQLMVAIVGAILLGSAAIIFFQPQKTTDGGGTETIPTQVDLEKTEGYWYQGEVIGKVREYSGISYYDYHYVMGTVGTYAEVNVVIFSDEGFPVHFTISISEGSGLMVGNDFYNIEGIDPFRGRVRWTEEVK